MSKVYSSLGVVGGLSANTMTINNISGTGTSVTNLGIDIDGNVVSGSTGGDNLPIVRYVYLVQDASDATLMGGSASNVYTTAQDAYDGANALQLANGGQVVIKVGNISQVASGDIVLTENYNIAVQIEGLNTRVGNSNDALSNINDIITNGFSVLGLKMINMNVNSILSTALTPVNSGIIVLELTNCSILTSIDSSANVGGGNGGNVVVVGNNSTNILAINTSSTLGNAGDVILFGVKNCVSTLIGGTGGDTGNVEVTDCFNVSINQTHNGLSNPTTQISYSEGVSLNQTNNSTADFGVTTLRNSSFSDANFRTKTSTGGFPILRLNNVTSSATVLESFDVTLLGGIIDLANPIYFNAVIMGKFGCENNTGFEISITSIVNFPNILQQTDYKLRFYANTDGGDVKFVHDIGITDGLNNKGQVDKVISYTLNGFIEYVPQSFTFLPFSSEYNSNAS